ncbi:MAG: leucyl aminopeptidase [Proteocatella sp.]
MKLNILHSLEMMKDYDSYVIPFFSPSVMSNFFDEDFCNLINPYIEAGLFKAKKGEIYSFTSFFRGQNKHVNIVLVGFGEESDLTTDILMENFGKSITELQSLKAQKPVVFIENIASGVNKVDSFLKSCKAMLLAEYTFEKYQTKDDKTCRIDFIDIFTQYYEAERCEKRASIIAANTILARDLTNEPSNFLKPSTLVEKTLEAFEGLNLDIKIYDQPEIEKFKMEAFLSVARGSSSKPKLIVINYNGNKKSDEKLALIGKGLTYDSGGYSIKPSDSMMAMKTDMAGAAAVIGAIKSIAESKLKVNVVAIVAACENMLSGDAYLPGDLIGSMGGKFIEVINTDAEGRLTLADAVTFAIREEQATKLIDIATLTGAVLVALGDDYAGIVANDEHLYKIVEKASKMANEKIWRLPLDEKIIEKNKSEIADIKNSGGKNAGASIAGAFISAFVEDLPWVHIDIAGTSATDKNRPYCRRGGTGYGVELLFDIASQIK